MIIIEYGIVFPTGEELRVDFDKCPAMLNDKYLSWLFKYGRWINRIEWFDRFSKYMTPDEAEVYWEMLDNDYSSLAEFAKYKGISTAKAYRIRKRVLAVIKCYYNETGEKEDGQSEV